MASLQDDFEEAEKAEELQDVSESLENAVKSMESCNRRFEGVLSRRTRPSVASLRRALSGCSVHTCSCKSLVAEL